MFSWCSQVRFTSKRIKLTCKYKIIVTPKSAKFLGVYLLDGRSKKEFQIIWEKVGNKDFQSSSNSTLNPKIGSLSSASSASRSFEISDNFPELYIDNGYNYIAIFMYTLYLRDYISTCSDTNLLFFITDIEPV